MLSSLLGILQHFLIKIHASLDMGIFMSISPYIDRSLYNPTFENSPSSSF